MRDRRVALVVCAILVASWGLRAFVAHRGGQYYSLDESHHFHDGYAVAQALLERRWHDAGRDLVEREHHAGFRFVSTVAALATWGVVGSPSLENRWVTASLLAGSSVAVLALVYGIARRTGSSQVASLLALVAAATATSLTYWARHLMPYDSGMAIDLLALWIGLRAGGFRRAALVGATAAAGFFTYYGYLAMAAIAMVAHVLRTRAGVTRRLAGVVLGAALVFALFEWMPRSDPLPFHRRLWLLMHGADESWGSSYSEGLWVPWAYLWDTEGLVLLGWAAATAVGVVFRDRRTLAWLAVALGFYAWMAAHSVIGHEGVVVGRFVRQMVPFSCLAAGSGAAVWWSRSRWRWQAATIAAVAYACAWTVSIRPVVEQRWPGDLEKIWRARNPGLAHDTTFVGSDRGPEPHDGPILALNTGFVDPWPVTGVRPPPRGTLLESYPHPLDWRPYQYEGYPLEAREAIRAARPLMALVARDDSQPPAW